MKKPLIFLFLFFAFFSVESQIISVCGGDTIELKLNNYDQGTIVWQESKDTLDWLQITDATGPIYKFHPTEAGYYRAILKTASCDPIYSDTFFVKFSPVANAGSDRIVGDTILTLLGSKLNGSNGNWSLFSGNGDFINANIPRAEFYGNYNETNLLVWTVTNECGTSSDTVSVTFNEIQANLNFVIVDQTDSIYSDSTGMANGIYNIKFSDPDITLRDSVLLIGIREDISFLQKVLSFSIQNGIYEFKTEEGSLEDLFLGGSLSIGDAVNQSIINEDQLKTKSFPTRKTIKKYKKNKGIKVLYTTTIYDDDKYFPDKESDGVYLNLPDLTIFESADKVLKVAIDNSYIKIDPNFVLEYDFDLPARLKYLKFGVDNAEFEYNYRFIIQATAPINFVKYKKSLLKKTKFIYFMAGPVPVLVTANFEVKASFKTNISAAVEFEATQNYKKEFTTLIEGENVRNLRLIRESSERSTKEYNFMAQNQFTSEIKIGPEISFKAYDFIGPYLEVPLKASLNVCVNNESNWVAEAKVGVEGNIGAKAEMFRYTLFDFNYTLFDKTLISAIKMPYKMKLISGNNQIGEINTELDNPIKFKVISNRGFGVPLVPVKFEPTSGSGYVADEILYTNIKGDVSSVWVLGTNLNNKLKVSVLDCDNHNISNSPFYIYAEAIPEDEEPGEFNCINSDLYISIKTNQDYKYPKVYGGLSPYTYSTDGYNYSSSVPTYDLSTPGNFMVYAKDQNDCSSSKSFKIDPVSPCLGTDLSLTIFAQENILSLKGNRGTPPYQFSIDNNNTFLSEDIYINITSGIHTFYVKDENDCQTNLDFEIPEYSGQAVKIVSPKNKENYVITQNVVFEWIAGTYAINQKYDLYLMKEGESYILIASNLDVTKFTYTTPLTDNSPYTWKLSIKNQSSVEVESREFTFTTGSALPEIPAVPILVSPSDGENSVPLPIIFTWDVQPGNFVYDLYLDDLDASTLFALNIETPGSIKIHGLSGLKTYFWKIKVKSLETHEYAESSIQSLTTKDMSVTDIDGNVYRTAQIGNQEWMTENLKVTYYNDDTPIPNITDDNEWVNLTTDAYCWYNNNATYKDIYGAYYNLYVVETNKICPSGWHVPTSTEFHNLSNLFGGWEFCGPFLKSENGWYNDGNGNNESGFLALPTGIRSPSLGFFSETGQKGRWWTDSSFRTLLYDSDNLYNNSNALNDNTNWGVSIRCVKD